MRNEHGRAEQWLAWLTATHELETPGREGVVGATWLMTDDSAPQPDVALRMLPEHGGRAGLDKGYLVGVPGLVLEVATSSAGRDLGPKLRLYHSAGVREYGVALTQSESLVWHEADDSGALTSVGPDEDGAFRSKAFPGLWIDPIGLFRDPQRLGATLARGPAPPEHAAFVKKLTQP